MNRKTYYSISRERFITSNEILDYPHRKTSQKGKQIVLTK